MKIRFFHPMVLVVCAFFISCFQEQKEDEEILAKINDRQLTVNEFEYQLAMEVGMDSEFKLTNEAKRDFLDQLIEKELLLQEAKNRKLDRRKEFMRTIERYWEATLIRDLMDLKGQEIVKGTSVTQEEIDAQYEKMKQEGMEAPPFEAIREKVVGDVMDFKRREKLGAWVKLLRKDAQVEINQAKLN